VVQDDDLVSIGVISGSYGLRGEVKIHPLTDFPERFKALSKVILVNKDERLLMEVEKSRPHASGHLIKFKTLNTREAADALRGYYLMIPEDQVFPLPEGSYYHFQLKGLTVYDEELGRIGILVDILETGANDVYVINSEQYGEVLIPAIGEVVLQVDLNEKRMKIRLLPGLID